MQRILLASTSLLALISPAAAQEYRTPMPLAPDAYCSPQRQQLPTDENTPVASNSRRNNATTVVTIIRSMPNGRNQDASLNGITSVLGRAQFQKSLAPQ